MSADRSAVAKVRALGYRAAGIEPGQPIRAADIPRHDRRAREAGAAHRETLLGVQRSPNFKARLRGERAAGKDADVYEFEGIASATDTPYEMYDWAGPYLETIEHGAFTETLAAKPDVAFLVNHMGVTMARTTNGSLTLDLPDEGLRAQASLNLRRTDIQDMVTGIDDGLLTEMSFAFILEEGWWSDDFEEFKISKVDLNRGDVSVVNYGANPYTSIGARTPSIIADLRRLPAGAVRAAMDVLSARTDVAELEQMIKTFDQLNADLARADARKRHIEDGVPSRSGIGSSILHLEAELSVYTD